MEITWITVEAESLDKAQKLLEEKIPAGLCVHHLYKENWKHGDAVVTDNTVEGASAKVPADMPKSAVIQARHVLYEPRTVVVTLEAADRASLQKMAEKKARELNPYAGVRSVVLKKPGSQGFLGMGQHLDRYRVEIFIPAVVKVVYLTMAKVTAQVGEKQDWIPKEMTSEDYAVALTKLQIVSTEEGCRRFPGDEPSFHNDPRELAKVIGENPAVFKDEITWSWRQSKTEYTYSIFRTGESTWGYIRKYEFLD